jgi:hypothetical protein
MSHGTRSFASVKEAVDAFQSDAGSHPDAPSNASPAGDPGSQPTT